ncbi:uncharacterized protein VTP21DRAFT_1366 [Calcarisporiella thermophila]|uniref:uncharacterized protein n=1 Tax=Calcarisporiella thermophila TaxID=911321 RepID=UPI003742B03A
MWQISRASAAVRSFAGSPQSACIDTPVSTASAANECRLAPARDIDVLRQLDRFAKPPTRNSSGQSEGITAVTKLYGNSSGGAERAGQK